jgi:hypothetical protein
VRLLLGACVAKGSPMKSGWRAAGAAGAAKLSRPPRMLLCCCPAGAGVPYSASKGKAPGAAACWRCAAGPGWSSPSKAAKGSACHSCLTRCNWCHSC